jgi:F-type H+-transporting ATPase subunit gamma
MQTLEGLRRRIDAADDLYSLVKTMKSLAMINIRHYEQAVASLADYNRTVEMGLQALLKWHPELLYTGLQKTKPRVGAIVFGSDQGMCGSFNESIMEYTWNSLQNREGADQNPVFITIGERVENIIKESGGKLAKTYHAPPSLNGITGLLQQILLDIEAWQTKAGVGEVLLFYNRPLSTTTYQPRSVQLLPLNHQALLQLAEQPWPGRGFPSFKMDRDLLFSRLARQFLFVNLYRAFAESAASENASRLATLHSAQKNIEESIEELNRKYHQQRQDAITDELLDVVAGFGVLAGN